MGCEWIVSGSRRLQFQRAALHGSHRGGDRLSLLTIDVSVPLEVALRWKLRVVMVSCGQHLYTDICLPTHVQVMTWAYATLARQC